MLLGFSRTPRRSSGSGWRSLERVMDAIVDDTFGEPVELHPWGWRGVEDNPERDPDRPILKTTGILVAPGAAVTGESGTGGGMASPLTGGTWLSLTEEALKTTKLEDWREDDRVFFPDRGEWYKIDHQVPSVTARPNIYLVRLEK
jgi:hypothetical protein